MFICFLEGRKVYWKEKKIGKETPLAGGNL